MGAERAKWEQRLLSRPSCSARSHSRSLDFFSNLRAKDFSQLAFELIKGAREHAECGNSALRYIPGDRKRDRERLFLRRRGEFLFHPKQQRRWRRKVRPGSRLHVTRILVSRCASENRCRRNSRLLRNLKR